MQKCKQCGEIKALSQFRPYYSGKKVYRTCRDCEKINGRYKYLSGKSETKGLGPEETKEMLDIEGFYASARKRGLEPPNFGQGRTRAAALNLEAMRKLTEQNEAQLSKAETIADQVGVEVPPNCPEELMYWLEVDLSKLNKDPDELEEVSDMLEAKYRPKIGFDPVSMLPIFDNTYRPVLNKIFERIDDFADKYYGGEDD